MDSKDYYCGPFFTPKFLKKMLSKDSFDNHCCKIHDEDFEIGRRKFFISNWYLAKGISRNGTRLDKYPKAITFLILTTLFGWPIYGYYVIKRRLK